MTRLVKRNLIRLFVFLTIHFALTASAAILHVDLNSPSPTPPYSDWSTAATNIQEAIDAASAGDTILVTNGIHATGGKVKSGDLNNRVALDKPVTVQSVNGPWVTTIQGAGATNGVSAVRCAWLTNGASLVGFTLKHGATRTAGGVELRGGGGVWCASSNAIVSNCIITSNTASQSGGGIYQGTLNNSLVFGNTVPGTGGTAFNAHLNNCTVVSNTGWGIAASSPTLTKLTNCIVYFNSLNYNGLTFAYSCTTPLPAGPGNFTNAPDFIPGGIQLSSTSPCRGAGIKIISGTDIFGEAWANPPSVGCAEWNPAPLISIQPQVQLTNNPIGFLIASVASGEEPLAFWWLRDGMPIENDGHYGATQSATLTANGINSSDAGGYQVVVSNAFGVVTSQVAQVVIRFADATGSSPTPPYTNWATAATTIQDAIDAASAHSIVLVTNGIYSQGGKVMSGDLTNRVAVDKSIIVQSVNGPEATVIEGLGDFPVTNGAAAVRCAWLTNNAAVSGFTLRGGATRAMAFPPNHQMIGGGVWGSSTSATLFNCSILSNTASFQGGGAYRVALVNCTLIGNVAVGSGVPGTGSAGGGSGGGAFSCDLRNCVVSANTASQSDGGGTSASNLRNCALTKNRAPLSGSGAYQGTLLNCTLTGNISGGYGNYGGAVAAATLTNCLVYGNFNIGPGVTNYANNCTFAYCNTEPLAAGPGNLNVNPQLFTDGFHLSEASPCRGAGLSLATTGYDIDGQEWGSPPSIGCDEWYPETSATQPVLEFAAIFDGAFRFSFSGQTGAKYTIQYTTNLAAPVAWETLQVISSSPGGTTQISDSAWTNAARFYRVMVE